MMVLPETNDPARRDVGLVVHAGPPDVGGRGVLKKFSTAYL